MDVIFNKEMMRCMTQKGRYEVGFLFLEPSAKMVYRVKSISPVQDWPDSELIYLEEVPSTTG